MSLSETTRSARPIISAAELAAWVRDARERTLELVADLSDEQLMGPRLPIVNPLLWEIGHVAWFQEKWILRHTCNEEPIRADADSLYDSIAIPHDTRWDLPLPSRQATLDYMRQVHDAVLDKLRDKVSRPQPSEALIYFTLYCVFHEDMHDEAFTYTRQTHGYPPPRMFAGSEQATNGGGDPEGTVRGDAEIPGGEFQLGARLDEPFVFDNEKWAHPVHIKPFAIARATVTQAEFLAFVEDGGYRRRECWSDEAWRWRESNGADHPVYWRRESNGNWMRRDFDRWVPLEPHRPVIHVNWFEAEAYCRWARRRLPSEAEWEAAAASLPDSGHQLSRNKRRYPWGDEAPTRDRANLNWRAGGCLDVAALPNGDNVYGCRQMIGNIWEWTSSVFNPYPGFVPDAYKEYSEPWFHTHKVLRGGCWATRSRLTRNTYRNYYTPDRRDVWAGFRTCRLAE